MKFPISSGLAGRGRYWGIVRRVGATSLRVTSGRASRPLCNWLRSKSFGEKGKRITKSKSETGFCLVYRLWYWIMPSLPTIDLQACASVSWNGSFQPKSLQNSIWRKYSTKGLWETLAGRDGDGCTLLTSHRVWLLDYYSANIHALPTLSGLCNGSDTSLSKNSRLLKLLW